MYPVRDTIQKKRDGESLSAAEIAAFVAGVSGDLVSDAQIAAFAMATWFRGMDVEEEMNLTLAMRDSGVVLSWPGLDGPTLDKHSTGGVGDLVSLILGPLVASCGAYVPMISGRGLGHTGGTLDKLESIPGFDCFPDIERFQRLVQDNGVAIIGQTDQLVPADRRLYAVRDVTATVASPPLIISSILSKKLAEGLDGLVLDIKYGSGAVLPEVDAATQLAREITRVSQRAGLPCNALITNMDQPLAWSAGNALEVLEAIAFLTGEKRHPRMEEVVLSLAAEMLHLGGICGDAVEGKRLALAALDSGKAAEYFGRMAAGQGAPADLVDGPTAYFPGAEVVRPVFPGSSGFAERMDMLALGLVVVALGGGRNRAADRIDPRVGLSAICGPGQAVDSETPLAIVHAASGEDWEAAAARIRSAVRICPVPVEPTPAVREKIEGRPS